jgi:hypothetical protein
VHPAILAVVNSEFVESIGKVLENLELPALHSNQHPTPSHRRIGVLEQHVEPLGLVLIGQWFAGSL